MSKTSRIEKWAARSGRALLLTLIVSGGAGSALAETPDPDPQSGRAGRVSPGAAVACLPVLMIRLVASAAIAAGRGLRSPQTRHPEGELGDLESGNRVREPVAGLEIEAAWANAGPGERRQ